jgi:naphthoate synthase/2-ketocyclohexanecarboxyl-CoA hydrolase
LHTVDEMFRAFYDANHDPTIGVLIVAGAGKHFGTGGDVEWEKWGLREAFYNRYPHNRLLRLSRKPIIAQVQGYCLGGHNHMAYCCDFTIAADDAVFGQVGPRVSSPADGFFVPYLTRVIGAKRAREMWMLCRRYTAQQALEMGLVNVVVPPDKLDEEVDKWCHELLAKSPSCLKILKASFRSLYDPLRQQSGRNWVDEFAPGFFQSGEADEGKNAFLERREPDFSRYPRTPGIYTPKED